MGRKVKLVNWDTNRGEIIRIRLLLVGIMFVLALGLYMVDLVLL